MCEPGEEAGDGWEEGRHRFTLNKSHQPGQRTLPSPRSPDVTLRLNPGYSVLQARGPRFRLSYCRAKNSNLRSTIPLASESRQYVPSLVLGQLA